MSPLACLFVANPFSLDRIRNPTPLLVHGNQSAASKKVVLFNGTVPVNLKALSLDVPILLFHEANSCLEQHLSPSLSEHIKWFQC